MPAIWHAAVHYAEQPARCHASESQAVRRRPTARSWATDRHAPRSPVLPIFSPRADKARLPARCAGMFRAARESAGVGHAQGECAPAGSLAITLQIIRHNHDTPNTHCIRTTPKPDYGAFARHHRFSSGGGTQIPNTRSSEEHTWVAGHLPTLRCAATNPTS